MRNRTRHFQNCLGVFQGGGCKGISYVGAYRECVNRGIGFSEIVGSSAGAIVAVLIAAGATPEKLEEILRKLDFSKFTSTPEKIELNSSHRLNIIKLLIPKEFRKYSSIFTHLGIFKSSYIEDFMSEELSRILKIKSRAKFSDLLIPCSVLASDLFNNNLKIFSSDLTPDDDVAKAVRCSANIPLLFQPVEKRFVDGGVISNLPAFVYKNRNKTHSKILAFTFNESIAHSTFDNVHEYAKVLVNTILNGSLNVQVSLMEPINVISIDTGNVRTTDFDKISDKIIDELINYGVYSVSKFIDNETSYLSTNSVRRDVNIDYFDTNNVIVTSSRSSVREVIISDINTNFVYELFPTLLKWVENGVSIKILLKSNTDDENHGPYRQRLLKALGANTILVKNLPFRGYIFDGDFQEGSEAIILNPTGSTRKVYHSKYYHGDEDKVVINMIYKQIATFFCNSGTPDDIGCSPITDEELFKKLRNVKQYNFSNIEFSIEEININEIIFLTKYVRGFKYRQINNIIEIYKRNNFELFTPIQLLLKENKYSIVTPPVIESHGDNCYLVEGNTRLTFLQRLGVVKVKAVIVKNVNEGLPSSGRYKVNEVLITDKETIGKDRYDQFDYEKFRKIEKAVRDPRECLL
ncbi:MAG: patatin-like phospholipase family protein [Desulfobulbaceae bacterium]|nr:patatin-like phospholipase family protein [Desulfobulbaceae bacterium]